MLANGPPCSERRVVLQRLHQVGRQRVLQQHRHRAVRLAGRGRAPACGRASSRPRCCPGAAFRSCSEVARQKIAITSEATTMSKPSSRGKPLAGAAEADGDLAQRAVVHVHHAPPADAAHVDAQRVAVVDVVVDHRRQQVVGQRDGVEVAGEVQVDVLHRHHLRMAAAGGAALHAEHRARARARAARSSPSCRCGSSASPRPTVVVVLPSPAGVGLIAVTSISLPSGRSCERGEVVERQLGLVVAVGLQVLVGDAELLGASSVMRCSVACWAISMSDGMRGGAWPVEVEGRTRRCTPRLPDEAGC